MENAAAAVGEADALAESIASERAGDGARQDGALLLALVHYRKAAELRSDDPGLASKIAETLGARSQAAQRRGRRIPLAARGPGASSIAAVVAVGVLTLGIVLTAQPSRSPVQRRAVVAAAPSGTSTADVLPAAGPIESPLMTTAESSICLADAIAVPQGRADFSRDVRADSKVGAKKSTSHHRRSRSRLARRDKRFTVRPHPSRSPGLEAAKRRGQPTAIEGASMLVPIAAPARVHREDSARLEI